MKSIKKFLFLSFVISFIFAHVSVACPEGTTSACGSLEDDECGGKYVLCGNGGNIQCCIPCTPGVG